jgi:hypothetical protein
MGEIGLKSGKIVKIRWNRVKSRFHHRFNDCIAEDKIAIAIYRYPVTIGIWPIAITEQKQKLQNHVLSDFQCWNP